MRTTSCWTKASRPRASGRAARQVDRVAAADERPLLVRGTAAVRAEPVAGVEVRVGAHPARVEGVQPHRLLARQRMPVLGGEDGPMSYAVAPHARGSPQPAPLTSTKPTTSTDVLKRPS